MRRQALLGGQRHNKVSCRRLWAHEALRIFHDRLVNDDDRRWFGNYLKAAVQEHLHLNFDEVFATSDSSAGAGRLDVLSATRSLLYCNFLTQVPSKNAAVSFFAVVSAEDQKQKSEISLPCLHLQNWPDAVN